MTDTLGSRLKRERLNKNLTQDQLATILSGDGIRINKSMLSKWENNREQPALDYLRRIAQYFQRSVDYFTGTEGVLFQSSREKADLTLAQAAHAARIPVKELEAFEAGASLEQEKKTACKCSTSSRPSSTLTASTKTIFISRTSCAWTTKRKPPSPFPSSAKSRQACPSWTKPTSQTTSR